MDNPLELTIPQVTAVFSRIGSTENPTLNSLIHAWQHADARDRATLYNAALNFIYRYKLENHVEPPLPPSKQSWADTAAILRGYFGEFTLQNEELNPEENRAQRRAIRACEILENLTNALAEVER